MTPLQRDAEKINEAATALSKLFIERSTIKITTALPIGLALEFSRRLTAKHQHKAANDILEAIKEQFLPSLNEANANLERALALLEPVNE